MVNMSRDVCFHLFAFAGDAVFDLGADLAVSRVELLTLLETLLADNIARIVLGSFSAPETASCGRGDGDGGGEQAVAGGLDAMTIVSASPTRRHGLGVTGELSIVQACGSVAWLGAVEDVDCLLGFRGCGGD